MQFTQDMVGKDNHLVRILCELALRYLEMLVQWEVSWKNHWCWKMEPALQAYSTILILLMDGYETGGGRIVGQKVHVHLVRIDPCIRQQFLPGLKRINMLLRSGIRTQLYMLCIQMEA